MSHNAIRLEDGGLVQALLRSAANPTGLAQLLLPDDERGPDGPVVGRRRAVPTGLHGGCPGRAGATFTKNRERFEKHGLLRKLFDRVVEQALVEEWASSEDFTVDGSPSRATPQ